LEVSRGLKYEFRKLYGLIWNIAMALMSWICKLEHLKGLKCKNGGLRIDLQIDFDI
jgi:hypothetical protein